MLKSVRIIFFSLCLLTSIQSAIALEMCAIEGDFVPWPWSEQFSKQVLNQNWIVVDSEGQPKSEITITKSALMWGLGGGFYSFMEKNINDNSLSWGLAELSDEENPPSELKFDVWQRSTKSNVSYSIKLGYWASSSNQMTVEDHERQKIISPMDLKNLDLTPRVCTAFKQRTDHVVGIIIEKVINEPGFIGEPEILYGLTNDPIYTKD